MRGKYSLEIRLIAWVTLFGLAQAIFFGYLMRQMVIDNITSHTEDRALQLAHSVALRWDVLAALQAPLSDKSSLRENMLRLTKIAGADFIVIGDINSIRIAHPDPAKIGRKMVGGDNARAWLGESYVSRAQGSMGESIRGKVPIRNDNGDIIGIVSVGFLVDSVDSMIRDRMHTIMLWIVFSSFCCIAIAAWISHRVKKALFGLQPEEIGRLYAEQEAILDSVRTGIIATDADGNLRRINRRAIEILELAQKPTNSPPSITDVFQQQTERLLQPSETPMLGVEIFLHGKRIVFSRLPLTGHENLMGYVFSMRPADELEYLSRELARVQAFAESMTLQTHDYANRLNTLGAMLQMQHYDEALELIGRESLGAQHRINTLLEKVRDPVVAGLLLGKYQKAMKMGVRFSIIIEQPLSAQKSPEWLDRFVTIIGNLIDNALEATQRHQPERPFVQVMIEELGDNWVIDVEDSGAGLPANIEQLYEPGVSDKTGSEHGVGLYLVKTNLSIAKGSIEVGLSDLGGTRITIYLPMVSNEQ